MSNIDNTIKNVGLKELNSIIGQLLKKGADFALYNLPLDEEIVLLASFNGLQDIIDTPYEQLNSGFMISPFIGNPKYIPAQFIWSNAKGVIKSYPGIEPGEEGLNINNQFPFSADADSTSKESYKNYVKTCIEEINSNNLQKIVPARVKNETLPINPFELFHKLTQEYKQSFISFICTNDYGTWIGASPELLVSTNKDGIFKTVSLAGTQLNKGYLKLRDVLWTQKEIEEQAMVSRYIINSFKKIRLREFNEYGPKSVVAGNLIHLKTEFEVDMEATNFPQLGSVMLKLLHPTSAVCGMPLDKSREFITSYEKETRKLYSGFLGPINMNGNSHIYVNLRCLELTEKGANFYAGAGVTVDSFPEEEFQETEIKIDTLKNLI